MKLIHKYVNIKTTITHIYINWLFMINLAYQQLLKYLQKIEQFKEIPPPPKGWVRAIRDGLGMSRRQLAERLGLSVSRIQRIESDEAVGSVTIKTMRQTAEAMDCVFVYAMVPRTSLEDFIQQQALKKAGEHLHSVNQTMALEAQSVNTKENQEMLERLAKQLREKSPRTLWDTK